MSNDNTEITVSKIEMGDNEVFSSRSLSRNEIGSLVAIRPCADEYKDKTYLGIYIGDASLGLETEYNETTKVLKLNRSWHNPAIYVFDLKKVIFGCESWWGAIKDESQLKQITNEDIDNIWYVKAIKQLHEKESNKSE